MSILSLGYVGVETPEPGKWEPFATEILGAALAPAGPDGAVRLRMDDRHHRIAIHRGDRNRLAYLGWELADETALDAALEQLRRAGLAPTEGTEDETAARSVRRFAWFADPTGVRHELFTGQLDLPRSFLPSRPMSGFVTGEQGVGHVALAVPDLKAAKAFYTQTMGFRLSDEIDIAVKLAFFHCNPRHHSLALGQVPGMRGILHLMMQVNELDDVGVAYDLVQSRGIPIYRSLGRHTNDRMVSFYVRTPGGFEIEYGWGAVAVDDVGHAATYMTEGSIWGHHPPDPPMRPGAIEPAVESVATA